MPILICGGIAIPLVTYVFFVRSSQLLSLAFLVAILGTMPWFLTVLIQGTDNQIPPEIATMNSVMNSSWVIGTASVLSMALAILRGLFDADRH